MNVNIRTNKIESTENKIKIKYTVIDSNIDYEYKIEIKINFCPMCGRDLQQDIRNLALHALYS